MMTTIADRPASGLGGGPVDGPAISAIVPSYNRRATLELVLAGFAAQRGVAPGAFDVCVVLDGSTDGSAAMLAAWQQSGRLPGLRWEARPNAGQAAARDAGARAAAAPVLLFVDDDVVPEPDLVARHLRWHAAGERVAVLGDCEIVRTADHPLYTQAVWAWWEALYSSRVLPGRLPCYTDFCAGNVSLRRADYLASGGFDPAFRGYGGEDFDLGYRLLTLGVRFVADRGARAMHHHQFGGYAKLLRSRRQEGHSEVLLGRKHPELRAGLRAADPRGFIRAAFAPREMSPALLRARLAQLALEERLGRGWRWQRQLAALTAYYYWRGVYDALGTEDAWDAFCREAQVPVRTVHVGRGIDVGPADFWVHGPSDLRVVADGDPIGTVRLPGPVMRPLHLALADAIGRGLAVPLLLRAEQGQLPLFASPADDGRGVRRRGVARHAAW